MKELGLMTPNKGNVSGAYRPESPPGTAVDGRVSVAVVAYTEYESDARVRRETEALVEEGYNVCVVALKPESKTAREPLLPVELHEIPLPIKKGSGYRYVYQYLMFALTSAVLLSKLHLTRRFAIVHVHSLPDFEVFSALVPRILGSSIILDVHESMPELMSARLAVKPASVLFKMAVQSQVWSSLFANKVVTATEGIRELLVDRGVTGERIRVVYNSDNTSINSCEAESIREALGLDEGRLIVHAGGINPERDLDTLIVATALLPRDLGIHLVIAGKGEARFLDHLRRLAAERGIAHTVHFTGWLPLEQAEALLATSEIGVVTSVANPNSDVAWPIRAGTFLHYHKRLVVPELRLVRKILGDCARYYTPGDPVSLASQVQQALEEPQAEPEKTKRFNQIREQFEWEHVKRDLLQVYRELLALRFTI